MFLPFLMALLIAECFLPFSASAHSTERPTALAHFPSLIEAELEDLLSGLELGLFTSVDLVNAYTARIDEINDTLHAVTELNPDAIAIATSLDTMRAKGTVLGPLHGIPILIKGNIATDDKMNTVAGSFALMGSKVPEDSTVVAKLRKAGAIILGVANLSEWANFRSANTSNGWSPYGGQVYGAYYPGQDPSGSSSGSGVASSMGLALATVGTETCGSILLPAHVNNLVAVKPTVGLTSRYLVIPISEHQDTIGPMARSVKDAAYLLQAIAGPDDHDNYTSAIPDNGRIPDYAAACDYNALAGARIGVARNVIDIWKNYTDPPVLAAFEEAVEQIKRAGATIVDANFSTFETWLTDGSETVVLNADFLVDLPKYFNQLTENPNNITDLATLEAFTQNSPSERWPQRDTLAWTNALSQGWDNTDPRFWPAYQMNLYHGGPGGILGALERTNTSAVLLPTVFSPSMPSFVGSPVVTVPMGFYPSDTPVTLNGYGNLVATGPNVPFGLSFMGPRFGEEALIGYAYAYEQRTLHRYDVPPYVAPNVEIADVVAPEQLDSKQGQRQCSKEWVARCGMMESWPFAMGKMGAPRERHWWNDVWEKGANASIIAVMKET